MRDDFPVNLTEVYNSPGDHHVENMNQLNYNPSLKDENLILAIKSGGLAGERAIVSLYTENHKEVKAAITDLISLYQGCKTEPDDMAHDAFLMMLHKIQFERIKTSSLKSYWIGIARKLMLNQVKKTDG